MLLDTPQPQTLKPLNPETPKPPTLPEAPLEAPQSPGLAFWAAHAFFLAAASREKPTESLRGHHLS